jgi:hypothetical protein
MNTVTLSVGVYGVEVRAYDPYMHYCNTAFAVTVQDTGSPTWVALPTDQTVEYGSILHYDLNATDSSGIDHYWMNDTVHFDIYSNGFLTNATALPIGVYGVEVRAYDSYGHFCSASLTVTVQDTTPPTWVVIPSDQVLASGEALDYQLHATDASGIHHWTVNDTVHFAISSSGRVTSITALAAGRYGLTVMVYDPYGNPRSATFAVTVQTETTTTTPPPIPGFPLPAATVGLVVALGTVMAMRRHRRKP